MSKNVAVFVDVANLYYSARGQDVDVDYVALLKAATKGRDLIRAYAYSGLDPENENQRKFIDFLGKNGYKVMTKDIRKFGDGRVKANLDIELVVDLFRLADRMDIAVIVSGDGDFAPAIRALQDKGVRCEVISFRPNTSSDLIAVTDEFIDVMKIAGIGRHSKEAKAQRGMSAPEMPAKEVVPEFGFREASPAVAKAALAAIKEPGHRETRGTGSGRGRRRSGAAAAAEPEEETATAAADEAAATTTNGDGEPRKRRRRRGGRGRGRGRGRGERDVEEVATGESASNGDIGWVEVDDVSQLAELEGIGDLEEDREYSFEEADAATLAELGLTPEDAGPSGGTAANTEPEQAEKKPTRRRSTTTRTSRSKKAAEAPAAEAEEPEQAEKKPTRRRSTTTRTSRSKKAAEAPAAEDAAEDGATAKTAKKAAGDAEAAAKPKSRSRTTSRSKKEASSGEAEPAKPAARRSRAKKTEAKQEAPVTEGAPDAPAEASTTDQPEEGIWRRFRSARGSKTTS